MPPLVARQELFEPENPLIIQQIALPEQTLINGVLTVRTGINGFIKAAALANIDVEGNSPPVTSTTQLVGR